MDYKGHKVSLGGSYSGKSTELFASVADDGVLQFCNVGREFTMQVKSENLESVLKNLEKVGANNVTILEWRKYGTTIANSGSSPDGEALVNVSLIPSAFGGGLRSLPGGQNAQVDKKTYMGLLSALESVLTDAGISDALYCLQLDKEATNEQYQVAVKEATLNALFNSGGVVGIE